MNILSNLFKKFTMTPSWHGSKSQPGDSSSVFTYKDGLVGFKPYLLADNQSQAGRYPGKHLVVDVRPNVEQWLSEQPMHLWKYADQEDDCHMAMIRVIIDQRLYTIMAMRWSSND